MTEIAEDNWFDEKYPNATCEACGKKVTGATVVTCGGGGGACETWFCSDCWTESGCCSICRQMEAEDKEEQKK